MGGTRQSIAERKNALPFLFKVLQLFYPSSFLRCPVPVPLSRIILASRSFVPHCHVARSKFPRHCGLTVDFSPQWLVFYQFRPPTPHFDVVRAAIDKPTVEEIVITGA